MMSGPELSSEYLNEVRREERGEIGILLSMALAGRNTHGWSLDCVHQSVMPGSQ